MLVLIWIKGIKKGSPTLKKIGEPKNQTNLN